MDSYDASVTIHVTSHVDTPSSLSSVSIKGADGIHEYGYGLNTNKCKINSVNVKINDYFDTGNIEITFSGTMQMIACDNSNCNMKIDYALVDSNNTIVYSDYIWKEMRMLNQEYSYSENIIGAVPPGNYTLVFYSYTS